ncbi:hypothetical protein, partial [Moorena sp. SIO2C4]|uniref:hypothetical protein n=1 Tax=Moorena sp. SIO2C4 TaxID=2607824 RepID=UPI00257AEEC8
AVNQAVDQLLSQANKTAVDITRASSSNFQEPLVQITQAQVDQLNPLHHGQLFRDPIQLFRDPIRGFAAKAFRSIEMDFLSVPMVGNLSFKSNEVAITAALTST